MIVMITGVSSGIGYAMAKDLCSIGYQVIGSVRRKQSLNKLQETFGKTFIGVCFDVTKEEEIILAKEHLNTLGINHIDVLINNAGIALIGPLEEMPIAKIRSQIDVNVLGLISVTNTFLPFLKKSNKAKIINMGSVSGIMTNPFLGAYCISKYGVESASDAYRLELKQWNIDVILLQPGPIKSLIWNKSLHQLDPYKNGQYAPFIDGAKKIIYKTEQKAFKAEKITKLIRKIIQGKTKKARYLIHKQAWMLTFIKKFVPDKWLDAIIFRSMMKHKKKV